MAGWWPIIGRAASIDCSTVQRDYGARGEAILRSNKKNTCSLCSLRWCTKKTNWANFSCRIFSVWAKSEFRRLLGLAQLENMSGSTSPMRDWTPKIVLIQRSTVDFVSRDFNYKKLPVAGLLRLACFWARQDEYRFVYYNHTNHALRLSNQVRPNSIIVHFTRGDVYDHPNHDGCCIRCIS